MAHLSCIHRTLITLTQRLNFAKTKSDIVAKAQGIYVPRVKAPLSPLVRHKRKAPVSGFALRLRSFVAYMSVDDEDDDDDDEPSAKRPTADYGQPPHAQQQQQQNASNASKPAPRRKQP